MKLAVIALTKTGAELAYKLEEKLEAVDLYLPAKVSSNREVDEFDSSLSQLVASLFSEYEGLIFVMALGIVVRILAPYLEDKRKDPAVVTIDETGQNVISTLSGHLGGANQLTTRIADLIEANPVVTTATDCQNKLAFDLLAQQFNCQIEPFANLKLANAALVNDRQVNIFTDLELNLELPANVNCFSVQQLGEQNGFPVIISNQQVAVNQDYLQLIPQNIVVGIGCRRGVSSRQVKEGVLFAVEKLNLKQASIKSIATIDLKQDEVGISEAADELGVPIEIVSRAEIKNSKLDHTSSQFVKEQIGVSGVCEPAAMLSSKEGDLLLAKTSKNQVTVAVVEDSFM